MTRGASTINPSEILYGNHASTRQAELMIQLTENQAVGLKAVAVLMLEHPSAPGFESYDICEAAERIPHSPFAGLGYTTAGAIVSSLVKKGLAEKTSSVFKSLNGQVSNEEHGWRLTPKGLEHAQLLGLHADSH